MTGWGNFETVHSKVIDSLPDGSIAIELGVAFGRGIETMVKAAQRLYKHIRVIGVDNFKGTPGEDFKLYYGDKFGYIDTVEQLRGVGVTPGQYEIIIGDTAETASLDRFKQVHYVFLDADHSYEGVLRDINAWWPRIVKGGYIGGHDWEFPTVSSAVKSLFKNPTIIEKQCWLQQKD